MDEERKDLTMQVDGMTCGGCVRSVRNVVLGLDPEAEVGIDLAGGRLTAHTRAQSLEIADALARAGYEARAMTG